MLHGELTLKAAASREGDETAASQREDGIGDNLVFGVGSAGEVTEVERGPIHPQEQSADEAEEIGEVIGLCLRGRLQYRGQNKTDSQSLVGPKGMNSHASSHIEGVNLFKDESLVEGVADLVKKAHENHLEGANPSDAAAEGD